MCLVMAVFYNISSLFTGLNYDNAFVEVDRLCRGHQMMDAVSTSETSVYFYHTTWRNFPEGCHLHIRRRENLKSRLSGQTEAPQAVRHYR